MGRGAAEGHGSACVSPHFPQRCAKERLQYFHRVCTHFKPEHHSLGSADNTGVTRSLSPQNVPGIVLYYRAGTAKRQSVTAGDPCKIITLCLNKLAV